MSYENTIAQLRDIADNGARKREEEKNAVDRLLELSHQRPKDEPETDNPLVNMVLRNVRR